MNNAIADLEIKISNIESWLQIHAAEEGVAVGILTTKGALKVSLEGQKRLLEGEIVVFNSLVDAVQPMADYLQDLIDHLIPSIDVPLPEQWKPESITIIVNGRDFVTFNINQPLKQGQSEWESGRNGIRPLSPGEYFVQGLRVNVVKGNGKDDYVSFIATPAVKMRGFSGWDEITDVRSVTVTGVLEHPPSYGLDAGVSFDLKIKEIDVDGQPLSFQHDRFIRIEYRFGIDDRFRQWHKGDTLRVTGSIKRDRDRTTFYEIHLNNPSYTKLQ